MCSAIFAALIIFANDNARKKCNISLSPDEYQLKLVQTETTNCPTETVVQISLFSCSSQKHTIQTSCLVYFTRKIFFLVVLSNKTLMQKSLKGNL